MSDEYDDEYDDDDEMLAQPELSLEEQIRFSPTTAP